MGVVVLIGFGTVLVERMNSALSSCGRRPPAPFRSAPSPWSPAFGTKRVKRNVDLDQRGLVRDGDDAPEVQPRRSYPLRLDLRGPGRSCRPLAGHRRWLWQIAQASAG